MLIRGIAHTHVMEYRRVDVEVAAAFPVTGGIRPLWFIWEDGRKFEINRVKFVERAPSHVGVILPVLYTCIAEGRECGLFYDPDKMRWFVEVQKSAQ